MISAAQRANIRPVHPFPARMAPSIVWDCLPTTKQPSKILDPMSGSGTTLVCARAKGHSVIGLDTDPLALLVARAWCSDICPERIRQRATLVLERASALAVQLKSADAYPNGVDDETKKFINYWFDPKNRRQLAALATCIARVHSEIEKTFLWCAFSRLIITKTTGVSLAMDVSHSRPHKVYETAPIRLFDKFVKTVEQITRASPFQVSEETKSNLLPIPDIRLGDARRMPVDSSSVDMIITSPPYLNAIDYLRAHKLSLVWMGQSIADIRKVRSENIGSEISSHPQLEEHVLDAISRMGELWRLDNRRIGMLRRYAYDMNNVLKECARVLKKKGQAIFVIGDSSIRGVFIKNSLGLIELASRHGFSLTSHTVRPLVESKRHLPPPSSKYSGRELRRRMNEEVILKFTAY